MPEWASILSVVMMIAVIVSVPLFIIANSLKRIVDILDDEFDYGDTDDTA